MARNLSPIPGGTVIVDKTGGITDFFRLRWEELRSAFSSTPAAGSVQFGPPGSVALSAALPTTVVFTAKIAGLYRISYYLRKLTADGVSSALTATVGWTETGVAQSESEAAVTVDAVTAQQSGSKVVWADANTDLTIAVAYASNTPAAMTYRVDAAVESLTS